MNIFQQFLKSIYSPKDVALFRFQGVGKTIGYVFLLMFISTVIVGISLGNDFLKWTEITNEKVMNELPNFELKKGTLTSELDSPIIQENNEFTFIFDTTGQITANDVSKYSNAIGLLKKEAIIISESEKQQLPYSNFGDISINKNTVINFIAKFKSLFYVILPMIFLLIYLFQTCLKFIGISVLALIGLMLSKQTSRKLRYNSLWILSAYAVTIPTIFFAITNALKIIIPFAFLLYWATASIVLYLIIVEIPKAKAPIETTEQPPE
ncbi:MAG TPA: DUF1189 domain-containing protein [Bacillus bacterium]|nr:DUF1189 domain-containing protein [Bacillus sp. (in: firmicutes)]